MLPVVGVDARAGFFLEGVATSAVGVSLASRSLFGRAVRDVKVGRWVGALNMPANLRLLRLVIGNLKTLAGVCMVQGCARLRMYTDFPSFGLSWLLYKLHCLNTLDSGV